MFRNISAIKGSLCKALVPERNPSCVFLSQLLGLSKPFKMWRQDVTHITKIIPLHLVLFNILLVVRQSGDLLCARNCETWWHYRHGKMRQADTVLCFQRAGTAGWWSRSHTWATCTETLGLSVLCTCLSSTSELSMLSWPEESDLHSSLRLAPVCSVSLISNIPNVLLILGHMLPQTEF